MQNEIALESRWWILHNPIFIPMSIQNWWLASKDKPWNGTGVWTATLEKTSTWSFFQSRQVTLIYPESYITLAPSFKYPLCLNTNISISSINSWFPRRVLMKMHEFPVNCKLTRITWTCSNLCTDSSSYVKWASHFTLLGSVFYLYKRMVSWRLLQVYILWTLWSVVRVKSSPIKTQFW